MGDDARDNDARQRNSFDNITVGTSTEAKARPTGGAASDSVPSDPSDGDEGGLAMMSTTINDNLRLFRAGTATMVVGSALVISVLVYRRGLHGYASVNQVPASYFQRRKKLRVRIAKVTASGPAAPDRAAEDNFGQIVVATESKHSAAHQGSDVLLHAEHITLPRRLLRLPPRSLLPTAGGSDAATFAMRLCGVSAEQEGISRAVEELVDPSVGRYCDAELLFREEKLGAPRGVTGAGASVPVAVCHIHRRRGVLWRDMFQSPLDPKAGFGERLVSDGLATLREERWWARRTAGDKDDPKQPLPPPEHLHEDHERFVAAEKDAQREKRGLWELPQDEAAVSQGAAGAASSGGGGAMKALKDRAAKVVGFVTGLFGR